MSSKARELAELGDVVTVDSGNVGIGTTGSPNQLLEVANSSGGATVNISTDGVAGSIASKKYNNLDFSGYNDTVLARIQSWDESSSTGHGYLTFHTFPAGGSLTERARIDNSGNVLVGKTSADSATDGVQLIPNGISAFGRGGGEALRLNRNTSDGEILRFQKAGVTVATIGVSSSDNIYFAGGAGNTKGLLINDQGYIPSGYAGAASDNTVDIGNGSYRYKQIYAASSSINTSDANEKQQVASLTSTEMTAAKAISKLFKTFKWNDAVAAKGDAARTHAGVIAQNVQQAMTDAGLDAADYGFWCSDTWWETSTEVPAVEADEENGIEAQEAYTRIDTYETAEEAPEGATKRTRLGVRYPELLAFIGAATEQRLADIETRLAALEGA